MFTHNEMLSLQAEKHELAELKQHKNSLQKVLHLIHIQAYCEACKLSKNKVIIDLDCNSGYGSAILAKVAAYVHGVDISKKAINYANKEHKSEKIKFQLIDGKTLPFKNDTVDVSR